MIVVKKVCFLSKIVEVIGMVIDEKVIDTVYAGKLDCWLVKFEHAGIEFCGLWPKGECE